MESRVGNGRWACAYRTGLVLGWGIVAFPAGCIDPVSGISGPGPGLGSSTDSPINKGDTGSSGTDDGGGPSSSAGGTAGEATTMGSGSTASSTTDAPTTANPTISSGSASDTGSDDSSTTAGTDDTAGDGGVSTNDCGLPNAYGDLGFLSDSAGTFGNFSPPTAGARLFVTPPAAPTFDGIFLQLLGGIAPFAGGPSEGTFPIDGTNNADPDICGVCLGLIPDASFGAGDSINFTYRLQATAGTVVIDRVDHPPSFPGTPRIVGHLEDVVFVELYPDSVEFVPNGCITTLDYLEFDTPISVFF